MRLTTIFLALLLSISACASGPSYYSNQPIVDMSPQAVMARGACTDLPIDHTGTANPVGWSTKVPVGMKSVTCGTKYASGNFYCVDPSKCGELVWASVPSDPKDRGKTWHGIVDLVEGSVTACAEPTNRFGWKNGIDCVPVTLTATDKGVRGVFSVIIPPLSPGTDQTSTTVMLSIKPAGTKPITIGQVGWAEVLTP